MRLDKYMTAAGVLTRRECAAAVKQGRITVDGLPAPRADIHVSPAQHVCLDGTEVVYRENTYLMMHKPDGIVSATDAPGERTVLDLLPEQLRRLHLFPCGRLDKSTTGLILLMTDGVLSHRLLAPRRHVEKVYRFTVKFPLSDEDVGQLENGIRIDADSHAEGFVTAPCRVIPEADRTHGAIVLTEGKYHQIKRMMEAVHNQITTLQRISFCGISLDPALKPGEWRYLTEEEEAILRAAAQ
ncbi:MAG: rRNA pseudouridine synthase [Clostridia bacterium]|nr:rRNA pseudouridine synthase [Clostridia bacterium]